MTYHLGKGSLKNLQGVHPILVSTIKEAITISPVDFTILKNGGLRTKEMQRTLVRRGASKTMNSKHRVQSDGYGHAADLVPYIGGQPQWKWEPIYRIAAAMRIASRNQGVILRWGGVWDRALDVLASDDEGDIPLHHKIENDAFEIKAAVQEYCHRHPGPDFIDGPHYEIKYLVEGFA